MKILVTGFGGFVSAHLLDCLDSMNQPIEIIGISRSPKSVGTYKNLTVHVHCFDLKQVTNTNEVIRDARPDYIIHLASDSSVASSWKNPVQSFQNNTNIFLNLVEAVRVNNVKCRILSIGSSEEYGVVSEDKLPLKEDDILNPISPYAVARVSQELISTVYHKGYGLDIIKTRSFNHIGPGQRDKFVISSFAKQIVTAKKNNSKDPILTGNLKIIRDFLDVRDVVKAYVALLFKGKSGELYNICNGEGHALSHLLNTMVEMAGLSIEIKEDSSLIRPVDNPIIIGSNKKLISTTNWKQSYTLETSLSDILEFWQKNVD